MGVKEMDNFDDIQERMIHFSDETLNKIKEQIEKELKYRNDKIEDLKMGMMGDNMRLPTELEMLVIKKLWKIPGFNLVAKKSIS